MRKLLCSPWQTLGVPFALKPIGIAASVAGHVGELAAVCRERVIQVVGAAGRRSSAGGAASCQVMSPGLSSVVSSTLVEGAPGARNFTRPTLVPSSLHFNTPAH